MGVLAHQRAAWGIKVDRPFTREEKKTWSQEERKMYKVGQQLQPCLVNASLRTTTSNAAGATRMRAHTHTRTLSLAHITSRVHITYSTVDIRKHLFLFISLTARPCLTCICSALSCTARRRDGK